MAGAHHVFICHSFEDAPAARAICERLEAAGIRCWIAPRDPVAGVPYGKQLVDAVEAAHVVLLVFSAAANHSQAVLNEIELASNRAKILLPVRVEDVAPSSNLEFYIRSIHWFDATTESLDLAGDELVRHAKNLLERAQQPAVAAGTRADVRTVNAPRHNLPFTLTSFVGRDREIREIEELLHSERLVTLAGTGGVGKTRCASRVGHDLLDTYRDGVWFVDLAEILEGALIPATIAAVFDLQESPNRSILDTVLAYLRNKTLLLILDNCEHLVGDAAAAAQTILQRCSGVSILATSRELLGIPGECAYRMPTLTKDEAVHLFADRAQSADRRFRLDDANKPLVESICRQLDGIPLAIELAAARAKALSVAEIDRRLGERFRILTGGSRTALPRHQTLHAAIDWSYELLAEPERALFCKVSIFIGGFTMDLAMEICPDEAIARDDVVDLVSSLVDKSLLQANFICDPTRYEMLESTREYARQRLIERGELEIMIQAHCVAYTELAERLERDWETMPDSQWTERVEAELPNFRPALRWTLGMRRNVAVGQRLAAALRPAWNNMAPSEGRQWIRASLEARTEDTQPNLLARLYLVEANLELINLEYRSAKGIAENALAIFTRLDDALGVAKAQLFLGAALKGIGKTTEAESVLQQSLATFRKRNARRSIAGVLAHMAGAELIGGKVEKSRPLFEEALAIYKEVGALWPAAHLAINLAEAEFRDGNAEAAVRLVTEALEADRAYNAVDAAAFDLCNLAAYLVALERWDEAAERAREALAIARERKLSFVATFSMQHLVAAAVLRNHQDPESVRTVRSLAAKLLGFVDERAAGLGFLREYTEQREYDAVVAALHGELGPKHAAGLMNEGRLMDEETAMQKALTVLGK